MDTDEGDNEEPLSLHKYLYCQADPINGVDPSGNDDIGDVLGAIDIGVTLAQISTPVSGGSIHAIVDSGNNKDHGFAYDLWALKRPYHYTNRGTTLLRKGKTIVENVAGITRFKSDVADVRRRGYSIYRISFFGHGDGGGTLGDPAKAQIGFGSNGHSRYSNAIWSADFEDLFTGIMQPDVTVNLDFCDSLNDKDTINLFRRLAPQADIWGAYGIMWGVGDYGAPVWATHYAN